MSVRHKKKIKVVPTAKEIQELEHYSKFGKSRSHDTLPRSARPVPERPNRIQLRPLVPAPVTTMRHPLTGVTSTHSLTSSSSATSFSSKYDTAPGMIPVPVTIKDPRMLEWMTEFDDGPQSSYVYRPTFLQFRSDDPAEDDRFEDIKVRSEALERNEMNTYYSKVRREAPFHWLMICCNLYSVTYSSYLLYKFSEFGESYVRNNVKSPLVAHRYLQCHVLLSALISLLEAVRRSFDVPFMVWFLWSRGAMRGLANLDVRAKVDDIKSLLYLLYCTWTVPGMTYETLRFFGFDIRVASPFQAFFPLAFVSYAALAIVRPLRGLSYDRVAMNFNVLWKIPVLVSATTLSIFYLINGYAVPAILVLLHAFVISLSNYAYFNVQVVNRFLVLLVQEGGFGLKILVASVLNWAYLNYIRGLQECFSLYQPGDLETAVLRCGDTVAFSTFQHRFSRAFENVFTSTAG